jgi:predicted site-specific integrase-resolvase
MNSTPRLSLTAGATELALTRALYSPKETEALLGISHATCYRLINAGKLDARKIASKTVITRESIERFLAELPKVGRVA